jgi:WD40 repeat protein
VSEFLEHSLICIMGRNNTPVGAGCLLTERHVVTCAHVVSAAIGYDDYERVPPTQLVPLEFAFAGGTDAAVVEIWWPVARDGEEPLDGRADLALLRLSSPPPEDVKPAKLADTDNIRYQNFETIGFPQGHRLGLPTNGVCGGRRRDKRILVRSQDVPIEPGFSGAPVWIEAYGAVGGILVERVLDITQPRLAFVIPASLLRAFVGIVETSLGRLFWVPDLPPGYVARPELAIALKTTLLTVSSAIAVSGASSESGLQGVGGIGKTVLASAVIRDEEIQGTFRDGVYWLTLGQKADVLARQTQLANAISREQPSFVDIQAGKVRLAQLLRNKRCLIVLDDVWEPADATAFDIGGTPSRLLITTRNHTVVEAVNAAEVCVPFLSADQALDMLANFSGQSRNILPAEAAAIVGEAGGLPLALAMAGRLTRARLQGWGDVLQRLRAAGAAAPRDESVSRAIQATVETLPPNERDLFFDLSVFPEDTPIPGAVLEKFWVARGLDPLAVVEQAEDFVARSLAGWDEERHEKERSDRLILHDLVGAYLRRSVDNCPDRHRRLLEAFRPSSGRWFDLPSDEHYLWTWLPFHLMEAGRRDELKMLLLDPAWIAAKLGVTDLPALMSDYDRIPDDADLRLVRQALTLSAHVLAQDKTQLTDQLSGRLIGFGSFGIDELLARLKQSEQLGLRLYPETGSLTKPGSSLLATLKGHQSWVEALAPLADGHRALSASNDSTVKLWDLDAGALLRTLEGHKARVEALAPLADGRRALSASADDTLKLWDLDTGAVLRTFEGHTDSVRMVALLADGRRVLSASNDKTLKLWDLDTAAVLRTLEGHKHWVTVVALLADGHRALSASLDNTMKLWDLDTGAVLRTFEGHQYPVMEVALLADGRRALSASNDKTLKLWDLDSGAALRTLEGHTDRVNAVALLADGHRALSASADNTLKLWDLDTGAVLRTLEGHTDRVNAVALLADGHRALSASADRTLKLWNLDTGAVLRTLQGHQAEVLAFALLADGHRVLSAAHDGTLKLWDLDTAAVLGTSQRHQDSVTAVALLANGHRALSASHDKTLKLWDLNTGAVLRTFEGHRAGVTAAVPLADGRRALSASADNTLKLWDLNTGAALRTFEGHQDMVRAVVLLAVEHWALSASHDQTLKLWDLDTGAVLRTLQGHRSWVRAVAALADGRRALSASDDYTLKLWNLDTGAVLRTLQGHQAEVLAFALLADGHRVLSAAHDGTLKLWDLDTGAVLGTFKGHQSWITAVAPLADGRRALSASGDNTLKLWDLNTGAVLRTLEGHRAEVLALALLADGRRALSASADDTLKLWDLDTGAALATFTADAAITSIAMVQDDRFVIGSGDGRLHFLRLIE